MPATITAIVPTYNRAALLGEALDALLAQSRPVAEIIVWDDGSTDATESVARARAGPVRYFHGANGGKSRALNAAMARARGDYVWICDDDDIALPRAAEMLAEPLDRCAGIGVSAASYRRFRTEGGQRIESGPGYWPDLRQGSVLRHLLEDIFLFQNATLARRGCYAEVGPFREDLSRSIDYDMIVRLAARYPVHVTEKPVFLQRKHDGDRGPAAARHAAARSDEVWKAADRAVFAPFRQSLPLALYEAMYGGAAPGARRRAALLQRGCVYARRTDWDSALEDFAQAAAILPDTALSRTERAICLRAMAGKHGCAEALAPPIRARLARLGRQGPAGAAIARGLLRGLVWRLRHAVRARDAQMVLRLVAGFARIGAASWRPAGATWPALTERREPALLPLVLGEHE
ncbi:glycosyltransferase family 2 protein [Limimaricola hongkongensis]|uniref:Glycosyl transferase, family 2 n=1 Tax=Limimaricola hongkongensis DSM 17492 TaxID=1122180 RepID=A0A017H7J7_9RHOB|nr:glycosyltransferase family 2 protein [Limimaricola hongkongensis]EYD70356.1 Glycosyl transferase, family 2 [Limimaricola hongkongensis DSM 17492]